MTVKHIVALSGPVGSGKSGLARRLAERYGVMRVPTRQLIQMLRPDVPSERAALQRAGEELDLETSGRWIADAVGILDEGSGGGAVIVIDSVRIDAQVDHLRRVWPGRVTHIHLTASGEKLSQRYAERDRELREFASYDELKSSPTEAGIDGLAAGADVVVQTDGCDEEDVLVRAVPLLGLYPRAPVPLVDVLVGAQYGSEGKGNIAAYLAQEYGVLMRVGGPNAGHKVAFPKHTFIQLPSGTERAPNAKLLIGPGATIDIDVLQQEIQDCQVEADRLTIDPQAMIIEPSDKRWEEKRLGGMGSTKQGVGVATARKILGRDERTVLGSRVRLARDIRDLRPYIRSTAEDLDKAYSSKIPIMLEGTQGTTLSLHHGFWPHVTSRDTTTAGCLADAGIAPLRVRRVVMITRTYPIRVGGVSGYMKGEIGPAIVAERSGLPVDEIESTERASRTGRKRRISEFDWVQLRRSATLNGPTDIALTFADYIAASNQEARRYEQLTLETRNFVDELEKVTGVPVSLISTRFHLRNIIDRRSW